MEGYGYTKLSVYRRPSFIRGVPNLPYLSVSPSDCTKVHITRGSNLQILNYNKNIISHTHSSHPCPSLPLSSYFYLSYHFYISHLEHLDFDTGVGHIT